jgi:hypothetical protein
MNDSLNTIQPSQQLFDEIHRKRVLRARRSPPAQKFCDGFELFELACTFMRAGIKAQHPGASDDAVASEMARRFKIQRQLNDRGIYQPLSDDEAPTENGE